MQREKWFPWLLSLTRSLLPPVIKQPSNHGIAPALTTYVRTCLAFPMSTPHRPLTTRLRLQRPPPLLLVICCLAALLAQQGVVAATPGTSSSSNDGTGTHTTAARTCVPLQGIESNATGALDPDRFLDLDVIRVSLKNNFNVSNPVGATFIECQASLETPIAMRNLLGGSP